MSINNCSNITEDSLNIVLQDIDKIIFNYSKFFNISEVFSSDDRGKIRLNKDVFNNINAKIQKDIEALKLKLNIIEEQLKEKKTVFLSETNSINYIDFDTLLFNDKIAHDKFYLALENILSPNNTKRSLEKEFLGFIKCKNLLSHLKYFINLFNTSFLNSIINRLSIEEIVNGTLIFEIVDSYGLQFQKLTQLKNEISGPKHTYEIIENPQNLNTILELAKRRFIVYEHNNTKYKIILEYNNHIESTNVININKSYFEQLLYSLMEQSCLDIIKKELKKGKIDKLITVDISLKKGVVTVVVVNSGFDTNDITIFDKMGNIENKFIIDAKNIARLLKCKLDIATIDNEGMRYTITFHN